MPLNLFGGRIKIIAMQKVYVQMTALKGVRANCALIYEKESKLARGYTTGEIKS